MSVVILLVNNCVEKNHVSPCSCSCLSSCRVIISVCPAAHPSALKTLTLLSL